MRLPALTIIWRVGGRLDVPSGRGWIGRYRKTRHAASIIRAGRSPLARSARDLTLRETFALAGADAGDAVLSVDGQTIVRCVRCTGCGSVKKVGGRILARMALTPCTRCGGTMTPAAADAVDRLSLNDAVAAWLDRPLAALGLVGGDVITLHARETALHYELGSTSAEAR